MKNKANKLVVFTILLTIMSCTVVFAKASDYDVLCSDFSTGIGAAVRIIGYVVEIAKWIAPLIIIVLGMVDFGKAVISSDDKAISKAASSLLRRFIAGVVIFFIPTILLTIFNIIGVTGGIENEDNTRYGACTSCILDASKNCPLR